MDRLTATSGKMVLLDKLMRKLHATGHRVLVFSQARPRAGGGAANGGAPRAQGSVRGAAARGAGSWLMFVRER